METTLRVLLVEDSESDALLTIRTLEKEGYALVYDRVDDAAAMNAALQETTWDVILCDYQMPQFKGPDAIALVKESGLDIPLIIVSGLIGEETAVEAMKAGAADYVMKDNLSRLASAIARELREVNMRHEKRGAEEALRESEERYRELVENASSIILRMDDTGRISFFNEFAQRFFGYSTSEIIGRNVVGTIVPETDSPGKHLITMIEDMAKNPQRHINYENESIRRDGSRVWISWTNKLLYNDADEVREILCIGSDITDRRQTEEKLRRTLESLSKALNTTIQVLVSAVEARDPYTAGHQQRVADLSCAIGEEMGFTEDRIDGLHMAGVIHDLGKLSIPSELLVKPTKLTTIEFALIKEHSRSGYEMLKDVESPWPLAEIAHQHHERVDGSGYPQNLKGDEILIEARIMAVADVVESMASHRPYRSALGIDAALEEIERNKGILYDNAVAEACLRVFREKGYQLQES